MNTTSSNLSIDHAKQLLKKFFGYDSFRAGQEELIQSILEGRDCLGIMPTGAGKSICYQIPSVMLPGTTVVISPLISLMKDQVDSLNQVGIPATFINSSLTEFEYAQTMQNASLGMYKIIYVAPERLISDGFINLLNMLNISLFAIDEAHCVSRWGHDFRPSYQEIANVILNLKTRPIVSAFTATATERVKEDIINLLHLESPYIFTTGFDRKNLRFSVETPENKTDFIINYLKENPKQSGIIYCLTRKSVDNIYELLNNSGFSACRYHGGMTDKQRTQNQDDFVFDRKLIMVATNAFGMGIDKSNIRFVIHYNMPRDIESYYQEAGRAGRDGDNSDCILLFSRADIVTNKFLIEQGNPDVNHSGEYEKLNDMVDYCNTDKCLRKYILEYFGEIPLFENCHNCSNCECETELTDITIDAKKILSCVTRMHEHFGTGMVTDVLKGSRSAKIKSFGFDNLSTYGIMHDYSKNTIKDIISFLVSEGYLKCVGDQYPILVLHPRAKNVLFGDEKVFIKRKIEKMSIYSNSSRQMSDTTNITTNLPCDNELFDILRELRMDISRQENVPPFLVFADISLREMSTFYPTTVENMLNITGVGQYKMENYGHAFLEIIKDYIETNNIDIVHIHEEFEKIKSVISNEKSQNISSYISEEQVHKEKQKTDTKMISYQMYQDGKSIKEIANIRGLTVQTIENHLLDCYESGLDINLEKYVQMEYKAQILKAMEEFGTQRLRPIKDSLPEEVTYFDIRYFKVVLFMHIRNNKP